MDQIEEEKWRKQQFNLLRAKCHSQGCGAMQLWAAGFMQHWVTAGAAGTVAGSAVESRTHLCHRHRRQRRGSLRPLSRSPPTPLHPSLSPLSVSPRRSSVQPSAADSALWSDCKLSPSLPPSPLSHPLSSLWRRSSCMLCSQRFGNSPSLWLADTIYITPATMHRSSGGNFTWVSAGRQPVRAHKRI